MATQLFLQRAAPDTHLGTNNAKRDGTATGWGSYALAATRGAAIGAGQNTPTVTGPTNGVEALDLGGTNPPQWISPPVAADVTISGTITANIWASESNMSANVAINVIIDIIRASTTTTADSNTIVNIVQSTNAVELAVTTRAVNNFTTGMTSGGYTGQTLNRGDRLRIRIVGDDSAAATMATGFTFNASWAGTSAAADGDSYVTFTENITFESAPGVSVLEQTSQADFWTYGLAGSIDMLAQPFVAPLTDLTEVRAWMYKTGTPSDNTVVEIQTDSGGNPSGTVVSTVATIAGSSLTTTAVEKTWSVSVSLTASQTYWLVFSRSGSLDAANYYLVRSSAVGAVAGWSSMKRHTSGGAWSSPTAVMTVRFAFTAPTSTVYLTNTASAVSTASQDLEVWTSRGGGVVTSVTPTAAGWTAPIQAVYTLGTVSHFPALTNNLFIQGTGGSNEMVAQSILSPAAGGTLAEVRLDLANNLTPADNLVIEVRSDTSGLPSASVVGTVATVAAGSLTATQATYSYSCSISLSASTQYWIVLRRSGARDTSNYFKTFVSTSGTYADGRQASSGSGTWSLGGASTDFLFGFTVNGTVIDWFTRPLTAFTLTGMAVANIRALESNAAANASLRCEIARVEGDGTSPTVWCSWCCAPTGTDNGELTTSEVARTINLSGDDLAITDGQRLRIRLYNEDISSAAMAATYTVTRYYAGTSGGASGDTYITFPQTLTEYSAPSAGTQLPFVTAPVFMP